MFNLGWEWGQSTWHPPLWPRVLGQTPCFSGIEVPQLKNEWFVQIIDGFL